jgi:hypothetical protein
MLFLLVVLTSILVATTTHVLLYGWRRAPADGTLRLKQRQKLWLGFVAALLVVGCAALVLFRDLLLVQLNAEFLQNSFLILTFALVALLYGASPSLDEQGEGD